IFTLDEMVEAFDISAVNANPARFDLKKCEAINAVHIREHLSTQEFVEACRPWLTPPHAPWKPEAFDQEAFAALAPLAQTRVTVLSDITDNVDFLFLDEPVHDERSWAKAMKPGAAEVLRSMREALAELADWRTDAL